MNSAEIKAYQMKITAQLQEANARISVLEAHAKGKLAQVELDAIAHLKSKQKEIDKKLHDDLKSTGAIAAAAKVKSEIDAEMKQLKTLLKGLSAKIKN